jgi:DNA (cytosine-5)-methyltransferase 1
MEAEGYGILPFLLPACAVNAPHRRDRIWVVAKNTVQDGRGGEFRKKESSEWQQRNTCAGDNEWLSINNGEIKITSLPESERCGEAGEYFARPEERNTGNGNEWTTADTNDRGLPERDAKQTQGPQHTTTERHNKLSRWENFPTQPPLCSGDDGIPAGLVGITVSKHRNESLKAFGNAVVPELVLQIFKAIEQYEEI